MDSLVAQLVSVDMIDMESKTQSREELDESFILRLQRVLEQDSNAPWPFPPIIIFVDANNVHRIGDGWHRVEAATRAGRAIVPAFVREGGEAEALWENIVLNAKHGSRLKASDYFAVLKRMAADPAMAHRLKVPRNILAAELGLSRQWLSVLMNRIASNKEKVTNLSELDAETYQKEQQAKSKQKTSKKRANSKQTEPETQEPDPEEEVVESGGMSTRCRRSEDDQPPQSEDEKFSDLVASYADLITALRQVKRKVKGLAEETRSGAYLRDVQGLIDDGLKQAISTLRMQQPETKCMACKGSGCDECCRTGFLTRGIVEQRKK